MEDLQTQRAQGSEVWRKKIFFPQSDELFICVSSLAASQFQLDLHNSSMVRDRTCHTEAGPGAHMLCLPLLYGAFSSL